MLPRDHRMRRPAAFASTIRRGRRAGGRLAVVYRAPAAGQGWTAGFVVSKAVGNSVARHRVTRRLRAVAAELLPRVSPPQDVVVRALPGAA
ncbi:MAG: ribonuclease P protein component, partial [Bifidobacteriaceae bacterium]|nr:ribonuclease P protein component [Bifidobacteriaceae bacterium]